MNSRGCLIGSLKDLRVRRSTQNKPPESEELGQQHVLALHQASFPCFFAGPHRSSNSTPGIQLDTSPVSMVRGPGNSASLNQSIDEARRFASVLVYRVGDGTVQNGASVQLRSFTREAAQLLPLAVWKKSGGGGDIARRLLSGELESYRQAVQPGVLLGV